MSRSIFRHAGGWVFGACFLCCSVLVAVEPVPSNDTQYIQAQVQEALRAEIQGEDGQREELLKRAAEKAPEYGPAHWHQGEVHFDNTWVKADQVASIMGQDRLSRYQEFRLRQEDTVEGNLKIANWCRNHGLRSQERAHLIRLLQHNPNHYQARVRTGFRRINGQWVSRQMLKLVAEREKQTIRAMGQYSREFDGWARMMYSEDEEKRQQARTQIGAIDDPQAIVVIENRLLLHSVPVALAAIGAIHRMPDYEAALALARQAVLSPALSVRDQAARYLRERRPDSFVPFLLANLSTPVTTRYMVTRGNNGQLLYRHMFLREVQGSQQFMVADRNYQRVNRGGSAVQSRRRTVGQFQNDLVQRETEVARQNFFTLEMNSRTCQALNVSLDMEMEADPETWWTWWNARNEVYMAGDKPTETLYQSDSVSIVDLPPPRRSYDCLAAGTKVATLMGPQSIETILVGDMVLSQDPETGELAYKTVMESTVRPKGLTFRIVCAGDEFETSGGHLFWVSGKGWVKSRELDPGMVLHTTVGSLEVVRIEQSIEQPTYNLVVEDFHTFFVGKNKILNHDNTVRQPTRNVVPGFDGQCVKGSSP